MNNNFDNGSLIGSGAVPYKNEDAPRAFLNVMFLPDDEAIDLVNNSTFAFDQVSEENENNFEQLSVSGFESPGNGYIIIYLSSEGSVNGSLFDIYFDDVDITLTESPIVQSDDYYPFGLTFNSYQRVTGKENKYNTFQDQEKITALDLNWIQFKWRNHDPAIGRFFNVDPLAESYVYNSPYAFSENNVTSHFELEGLEKVSIHLRAFHPSKTFGGGFSGDNRGFSNSPNSTARVKTNVNIDFNQSTPQVSGGTQTSDPSHHPVLGTDKAPDREALSNVSVGETTTGAKMVGFQTELEGANPLTPSFATPNIDLDGAFSISSNQETGIMSISANVTGDKFPSTESFITDEAGNSVYIGVAAFEGNVTDLSGEGGKEVINNSLQIKFDTNGNFQNVIYQGQEYNLNDYNSLFQNQNASGN